MKFLILGSKGFIGTHCVRYFIQRGFDVIGADLLLDTNVKDHQYICVYPGNAELQGLFKNDIIDVVINAAGSGSVPFSIENPNEDFKANCTDTFSILELIRQHSPKTRYIHISSAAVYGNPKSIPVNEMDILTPLSPYGYHKFIAEKICTEFNSLYKLRISIVRPFSVYGPGLRKQLFWDVYHKFTSNEEMPEIYGSGKESRDFVYVEDLVRAIALILEKGELNGEVYNVGSGVETSISDAIKMYLEALGIQVKYTFNGFIREGDPLNWRASIIKLQDLGYHPQISLKEGLSRVALWIKNIS